MAASKLHLKNVNKDYKLEATDKRTNEGRIVYKNTKTGELHSELSMTLEMPKGSGNWINIPSLINGRVYNVQGVLDMLKAGNIEPNSTGHATQDAAVEAAIYRSNNLIDDVGVSLKPNNEINLVKSQLARITEQEAPGLIAEINRAENAFQNQETGFPEPRVTRADVPAYTSGSGANADILAAAETALASDQQTQRLGAIIDNANLEKEDNYFNVAQSPTNIFRDNNPNYRNSLKDMVLGRGIKGDLKAVQNKDSGMTISAADQEMFNDAKLARGHYSDASGRDNESYDTSIPGNNEGGEFSGRPNSLYQIPERTYGDINVNTPPSDYADFKGTSSNTGKDNESFDIPILGNDVVTDGSKSRFEYKPHMNPEEKMKDNRNIKGLTPTYGEMPGFKKAKNGNYWSADENSEFWKTDAGYEKAQQTWGRSGGPLPNYVKRPKRKELDVEAIKNFFTPKASGN